MAYGGELPGGLPGPHGLRRGWAFRRADGALEIALADAAAEARNTPDAVSRALVAALEELGGEPPIRATVDELCVADRQFLMRELDAHLGNAESWFDAVCARCASAFDFRLDPTRLPVKPAGSEFPLARLRLGRRQLSLRVPAGGDQLRVLAAPAARRREALLRGLEVIEGGDASALPERLTAAHFARCEAALESQAPEISCTVSAPCPECGHLNLVGIDPYGALAHGAGTLLAEVHRLAWHYHWSEAEILRLPRDRRARYLALIDAARGMSQ
jgi:hypothetical protein